MKPNYYVYYCPYKTLALYYCSSLDGNCVLNLNSLKQVPKDFCGADLTISAFMHTYGMPKNMYVQHISISQPVSFACVCVACGYELQLVLRVMFTGMRWFHYLKTLVAGKSAEHRERYLVRHRIPSRIFPCLWVGDDNNCDIR